MKKQLYRAAAATVLGLSLTTGIVAADTGNNISQTGPNSSNRIHTHIEHEKHVNNDNTISLSNSNDQSGYTGDATVEDNTTGGTAASGDVKNDNYTSADVTVDNSWASTASDPQSGDPSGMGGSISYTGPNSSNSISTKVENKLSVDNNNDITVSNSNTQSGTTGDATVSNNTTGGNATTGTVYNTNTSKFTISVTN